MNNTWRYPPGRMALRFGLMSEPVDFRVVGLLRNDSADIFGFAAGIFDFGSGLSGSCLVGGARLLLLSPMRPRFMMLAGVTGVS